MWLISILILLVILGIIVLIHEFGHFITAKKSGVFIYEFSIGMGPLIWKHIGKDKIQYSIRAFPIGGYVQMAGEVMEDDNKIPKDQFMCNRPWYQRLIILVAGVTFNFLLAIVVLFFMALIWGGNDLTPRISGIMEDSAIAKSGIEVGDIITAVNGKKVYTWDKAQLYLTMNSKDGSYDITVKKANNEEKTYEITPETIKLEDGTESKVFGLQIEQKIEKGFIPSIKYAFAKFASIMSSMVTVIAGLFTGSLSLSSLAGPVGMYSIVDQSISLGIQQLIYLVAFLSINLGFVNILPFPAFDGGRVLFLIIEKIKGSPVNSKVENYIHLVGFALLILLMIYITIQDIFRLF